MSEDPKKAMPPRPAAPRPAPPRPPMPPRTLSSDRNAAVAKVAELVAEEEVDQDDLVEAISVLPPDVSPAASTGPAPGVAPIAAPAFAPQVSAPPPMPAPVALPVAPPPVAPPPVAPPPGAPPPVAAPVAAAPPAPAADDSRSSRRFPFEINVDIVSEHNFYAGLSLNISEGGLFVATHVEYPVGTKLEIRLLLPGDEEPTALMTEVRWVRPHNENADGSAGMGLRFLGLTPDVLAKVSKFAQNRDPLYYEDD